MLEVEFQNLNITIVGLGLIGGSMAKAIKKYVNIKNLWAIDIEENILNQSKQEKIIDEGYIDPTYPLNNSDIIILCAYPNANINFIKSNMDKIKSNCIITDTSGIKSKISTEINKFLKKDLYFIGGHPMAGKECVGYKFSSADIFKDASYILTYHDNQENMEEHIRMLEMLFYKIGFKNISVMSCEKHDEIVAFTSQVPHLIACALVNSEKFSQSINCMGGSFRDATRVANVNAKLWSELIFENKDKVLDELSCFIKGLNEICDIISSDNKDKMMLYFEKSSSRRKDMII